MCRTECRERPGAGRCHTRYRRIVDEGITPKELEAELGVGAREIRRWLREQGWQSVRYTRWRLSPDQAARVREHFAK